MSSISEPIALAPGPGTLHRFRPGGVELRQLLRLALPIVGVQLGIMVMGVVDTIMVGRLSAEALAATAIGHVYFFIAAIFAMGSLMALDPLVSQAVGANDNPAIRRAVQRGLVLAFALSIFGSVFLLFAEPVLRAARQPAEIVPLAALYDRILIPGLLPLLLFTVLRQTLQSMTRMRAILITIVVANIANVLLNWVLIFGKLGMPQMGVAGAAWATTVSRWVMLAGLFVLAWRDLRPLLTPFDRTAIAFAPLKRMLSLGAPIGMHSLLEYSAFGVVSLLMGLLGTIEIASHQIAINLASLTFMVPMGVAQAGSVLIGQAVGRADDDAARRAAGASLLSGAGFMMLTACLFLSAPHLLAGVYTTDIEVLALATVLIQIAGVFQIFDGLQVVGTGVLRGIGDTRVPMLAGLVGFWLIGMPISALLGFRTELGARGLWWGFVAGLAAVAAFLVLRILYRFVRPLSRWE